MIRPDRDDDSPPREPEASPRPQARRRFPPFAELVASPATSGLALLAFGATLLTWAYPDVDSLTMQGDVLHDAPWRPFTSALVHVDVLHLAFNLYWLLVLGVHVERENGSLRTFLGYAMIAAASSLTEQAFLRGGVGLSGIGYGVFAYGWVRSRSEPRWAALVDARTTQTFVVWFFFCIATTVSGVFGVANIAHGVGALVGALAGLSKQRRAAIGAMAASVVVAFVLDLRPVRDRVNFAGQPGLEAEAHGLELLGRGDAQGGVDELLRAVALSPGEARAHFNLGVALSRVARDGEACDEYQRAHDLDPGADYAAEAARACAVW